MSMIYALVAFLVAMGLTASFASAPKSMAKQFGLPLDESTLAYVESRASSAAWGAAGGIVAGALTVLLLGLAYDFSLDIVTALVIVPMVLAGYAVGAALGSLRTLPKAEGPRFARLSRPHVRDYVSGVERALTYIAVGGGLIASAIVLAGAAWGDLGYGPAAQLTLAAPIVAVVLLIGAELGARWLTLQPQYASSSLELAWDDALRARTCRYFFYAAGAGGVAAAITALGGDNTVIAPDRLWVGLQGIALVVMLSCVVIAAVVLVVVKPGQHFHRRLWSAQEG